ncbi:MAG: hypothetical protein GPJ54_12905 [Candidatus Heimdallarchaeota archaeon]|nr:hypothetical protein [Candidatus Heimdallarchaeota archaeon]
MSFLEGNEIKILFSREFGIMKPLLDTLFSKLNENGQIILIDPKRSWNIGLSGERVRIFQPRNLNEFVTTISDLNNYISPRLNSIIINDLHYFLRDYRGKSTKNVVINNRILAICLSLLKKIAAVGVDIIGLTYENPIKRNLPLSHKIINYYGCDIYQIENFLNNRFKIRKDNLEPFYFPK